MKKYSILFGTVLAAMSFVACQKEVELVENPVNETTKSIPFVLKADVPEMATRTTLDPSTWALEWENGDIIYAVTVDGEWGVPFSQDSGTESIAEFVYDSSSNSFATSKTITDDDHTFNFVYSNGKQKSFHRSDATTNQLSASQTMTAGDDATKQLKQYDAMAAQLTVRTPTQFANIQMSHLYTLMKVTLKNRTGNAITVNKFEMTAPNAVLATIFTVSFGETPSITPKADQTTYDRITVDITDGNIAAGADMPVYFIMAPLSSYNGDITFKATTSDNQTFTKTNTVSSLSFEAGAYNTASFTLKTADAPEDATYNRITSMSDLTTGDYVIVGEQKAESWGFFDYNSTLSSGRVAYSKEFTSASSLPAKITNPSGYRVWHIDLENSNITLYNEAASRYLRVGAGNGNISWNGESGTNLTPSVSNGLFAFSFAGTSTTYYLGVNKGSDYWKFYAASTLTAQNGLAIYKKEDPNLVILNFDKSSETFLATDDNTISKTFTATTKNVSAWTVTNSNPTDFTVEDDVNAKTVVVKPVSSNSTFSQKTATITVAAEGAETQTLTVTQAAKVPVFQVSANTSSIPAEEATAIITVNSNVSWQVSYNSDLAYADVPAAVVGFDATEQSFEVLFEDNDTDNSREIVFTITPDSASGLEAQTITFTQSSLNGPAITDVVYNNETIHSLSFNKNGETKYGLYIETNEKVGSNPQLSITGADAAAFSYSVTTSSSTEAYTYFNISATKNENNAVREATLTITYGDAEPWVVSLTQEAGDNSILKVDFESALTTYSAWEFTNLAIQAATASLPAKDGSNYASTDGKESSIAQTKNKIASPKSLTCYYTKLTSNNNTNSKFTIEVSSNGSSWTAVATGKTMNNVTAGEWEILTADLSSYSNVYVRVKYTGTTAKRGLDEITLVY